jgi:UDP-GlcNAc:undecaprenyl-phosphate/decaprenyl-phosphate GlcNAc-1-phosphate transferase
MDSGFILPLTVVAAFTLSFALAPLARAFAFKRGVVDEPIGGRKIHRVKTALLGGIAPFAGIAAALALAYGYADGKDLGPIQIAGFAGALVILLVGGILDDVFDLRPGVQFLFPLAASILAVAAGSRISIISNPFGPQPISLDWARIPLGMWAFGFPSDLVSILWLLVVTYAMKFLDGLDGLVAGMAAIGGLLIALLASSPAYAQPAVALLALAVSASYLGFLPWNRSGSIFLAESGSTIAGFSLGILAIISGAKVATASAALGVPLVDIVLVVVDRLSRGVSPFKGDSSHLHFRLLAAGFSSRAVVRLIWAIALVFGLVALLLQTKGKIFLLVLLAVLITGISAYARGRGRTL